MASAVSATETRVRTSVDSVDELSGTGFGPNSAQGVDDTPMDDGDLAFIKNGGGLGDGTYYHLDKESGAFPDQVNVILTASARLAEGAVSDATAGLGRWLKGPPSDAGAAAIDYKFLALGADALNSDDTQWTDLLVSNTLVVKNANQRLLVHADVSGSVSTLLVEPPFPAALQADFRIIVDNATVFEQDAAYSVVVTDEGDRFVNSAAISALVSPGGTGLAIVRLQWRPAQPDSEANILRSTAPNSDHAVLIVQLLS